MAGGGIGDYQGMWRAQITADYFNILAGLCQTCHSQKECGKFFCVDCRVGGVCQATFEGGVAIAQHNGIRIWKVIREFSVCIDDVRRITQDALHSQIQLKSQNGGMDACALKAVKLPGHLPDADPVVLSAGEVVGCAMCVAAVSDFMGIG